MIRNDDDGAVIIAAAALEVVAVVVLVRVRVGILIAVVAVRVTAEGAVLGRGWCLLVMNASKDWLRCRALRWRAEREREVGILLL